MTKDMTEGRIIPQLTGFTIPLVLGNLFQLTYNAADSVIVGKFVGDDALAAVGTAGPIMNMVILFISGMCMGAGILMSTHYGAKKYNLLERQISTSMLGGLVFSAVIAILLILFAHPLLELLQVPGDIIEAAKIYLRIIFVGLIFTFVYNFFSNTLRALGDSKVPLYFLIVSAFLNVVGDLFFVVVLEWGVPGSAVATVLSEALCCLCCLVYIKKKVPLLCLGRKWMVFDGSILWRTFNYGITSALQQMCVQLGKICVQTVVNVQGVAFIAAFTAINRVDDFAMTPQQNIAHATTTFMAQNRGAGKIDRMKRGFLSSIILQAVYTTLGGSHQPGRVLSSADRIYVLYAVGDQHHTGIFQGAWRPEGHADQHDPEYVGAILFCMAHDPCHARRIRPACLGEFLRMGRNAGIPDPDDRSAVEKSKVRFCRPLLWSGVLFTQ